MKFHSLRTSLAGSAFALIAGLLVASCGGSGAGSNNTGGNLVLRPLDATFYAGVPATMTIAGGRRPYRVTSSEPGLFPVPNGQIETNTFTVIPNNPGVLDNTVTPGQLPIRSLDVTVIDAENNIQIAAVQVAQNFLTSYGLSYTSNCATATGGTGAPPACAGGETLVRLTPTFNGNLVPLRTLRIETVRGPVTWVYPNGQVAGNTITITSDHEGKAFAIFRADANVPTQFVIFRVTDVETGASTEQAVILSGSAIASQLTAVPDTFTFTGPDSATCGTGSAQFLVFDGVPPYRALSSFAQVVVSPAQSDTNPGLFQFSVNDPSTCLSNATIVITDSRNAHGEVTVSTSPGQNPAPPAPIRAVPSSVTLTCAAPSQTVLIVGADPANPIAATSNDPQVTAIGGAASVTITWTSTTPGATDVPPTKTATVTATDGATTTTITVRRPTDCS